MAAVIGLYLANFLGYFKVFGFNASSINLFANMALKIAGLNTLVGPVNIIISTFVVIIFAFTLYSANKSNNINKDISDE